MEHFKSVGLEMQEYYLRCSHLFGPRQVLVDLFHVEYVPFKIRRNGYFHHRLSDSLTDDMIPHYQCGFSDCGEFGIVVTTDPTRTIYCFSVKELGLDEN
jgi:hypothetical protein